MNNEKPIRVLHILGSAQRGGTESVVFNYYRAINRSKVQFDIVIDIGSHCDIHDDIKALGCKIYRIPSYRHIFKYIPAIQKICKKGNYKIIHSHMNAMSIFSLFAAWTVGVPIRIAYSHTTAGKGKGEFVRNALKYTLRYFSKVFANKYMACSEYAARWLFGNRAVDKGQVFILNNAVDTDKFKFDPIRREKVRKEIGIEDKFVVGHIGRFSPQKNHLFLIEVFNALCKLRNDAVLLLIGGLGSAGDGVEKKIMARAAKLGLAEKVIFYGTTENTGELYQAMDVLVLPSLYEELGMESIEAQCSGLPCVLSDKIPKLVQINKNVIFLSLEKPVESWAAAISDTNGERGDFSVAIAEAGYGIYTKAGELEMKITSMEVKNNVQIKVLHIGLDESLGGIEVLLYSTSKEIDKNRFKFDFVSYVSNYALKDEFESLGVNVYRLPSLLTPVDYFSFWKRLIKDSDYDFIHFHKNSLANIVPIIVAKVCGTGRIIIHSHNTNPSRHSKAAIILHYINRALVYRCADKRIACSEAAGKWMFGTKRHNSGGYTVIHNGINSEKFKFSPKTRKEVRRELGLENKIVIGHVGRFSQQKNHTFLIEIFAEAVKLNPQAVLMLVGDGELRETIKQKAEKLALLDKVYFLGNRTDVYRLYQAMDVFALPSIYEGFAIVRVEAQASGLSAVMSAVMGNEPIKSREYSRFLSLTDSPNEWAKTLLFEAESVIGNDELRFERSEIIADTFDIKYVTEGLQRIYTASKEKI